MLHFLRGLFKISRIFLVLLLIVVTTLSYYFYTIYKKTGTAPGLSIVEPTPTVPPGLVKAPTPYLLLPKGRQEYLIREGASNEPKGSKIIVDPLDAQKGQQQTVTLDTRYSKPIESVSV